MKLLSLALLVTLPAILAGGGEKPRETPPPGFVKVQIKGRLKVYPEGRYKEWRNDWQKTRWNGSPYRVIAPDDKEWHPRNAAFWGDGQGVAWELFLGDRQEWIDLAKRLDGKLVLVSGSLALTERPGGPSGYPISGFLAYSVKVDSFEEAKQP